MDLRRGIMKPLNKYITNNVKRLKFAAKGGSLTTEAIKRKSDTAT